MCILCVASKWSRRIVTMLPWLVIPLVILWALSQLLPPGFRFEVTSPRLACVAVLLVSLGWYELVMPKLSEWRSRRQRLLMEKRRVEAQEAAKLRKEATRKCRNCSAPYKDQSPGGGRFMCTNCGHVSKRPVLEVRGGSFSLPASVTGSVSVVGAYFSSGSPKNLNGRASQDRSFFRQDRPWIYGNSNMNGSWFGGSWPGSGFYFGSEGSGWTAAGDFVGGSVFEGERCSTGESYFGVFWLVLRVVSNLILLVGWILQKFWRAAFPGEEGMVRSHQASHSRGYDVGPSETRGEKARRKAEEKRLARLEKEQSEAEERRQREEVARLVEEQRRQRDEKLEAQKESDREAFVGKEREVKREKDVEKKRHDKVKEREKVQGKERSKEQELEESKRKKGKESEKKAETGKTDGEDLKSGLLISSECGKVVKGTKLDTTSKASEAGMKAATSNTSKWGSSKYLGSAKTSFWGRSFSAGSIPAGKSTKGASTSTSPSASPSNSSMGLNVKPAKVSASAWNRTPWASVWGKAGHQVFDNSSRNLKVVDIADRVAPPSGNDTGTGLIDGAVVSPSTVGVVRQPIAPPSTVQDLRDNLFSGPIGFPPVQLPVGTAYQGQVENMVHQVPYAPASTRTQSYFASSTSDAVPGTQVLRPCMCSDSTELSTTTSLPPVILRSSNMLDYTGTEIYDSLSQLDFMFSPLTSSSSTDFRASFTSLSPLDISPSTGPPPPGGVDVMGCNPIELQRMLEPWNVPLEPSVLGSSVNDKSMKGLWHHSLASQSQRANSSQPCHWDAPFQQGIYELQPFNSALPDASLKPELDLPLGLFSSESVPPSSIRMHGEYFYSRPVMGSNKWVDLSPKDLVVGVSEDVDINESVPPEFVDCITHLLMEDPVITADGHSYERSAIEAWLKSHDTSPKTGEVLPPPPGRNAVGVDKTLRPNHILRGQIIEYRERISRGFGQHERSAYPGWNMTAVGTNSC